MIICLTGPKHCGKSSAALALKKLYGFDFFDLDSEIESFSGKSPRSLYKEGAEVFREAEAGALSRLLDGLSKDFADDSAAYAGEASKRAGAVIASGGGIIDNGKALAVLKSKPVRFVFLDVNAETAWERIKSGGELPPFLLTDNPRETHRVLHERRAALYRKAAFLSVDCGNRSAEEIAAEIYGRLRAPLR